MQPVFLVAIFRADRAGHPVADVLGQQDRILDPRGVVAEGLEDRAQLADRHALAEQHLQDLLHLGQFHHAGNQLTDHGRRGLLEFVDEVLGGVAGEDFVGVFANRFGKVRGRMTLPGSTTV